MEREKILFLYPMNLKEGQPAKERIDSFIEFYKEKNFEIYIWDIPSSIIEKFRLIYFLYKKRINYIFLSMPPFRNWFIFGLPFIGVILDIRDGWSIAMESGYGGTVKPKKIKAFISRMIERVAIKKSKLTITCTPGLQKYLKELSSREIILIINGYRKKDYEIVQKLKSNLNLEEKSYSFDIAVVAGKFSEYGEDKVKKVLNKINSMNKKIIIKLIGVDISKNRWVLEYVKKEHLNNIKIEILSRLNKEKLYEQILKSNFGITIVRDPSYDLGTKVFDYILCEKPIYNYFEEDNEFTNFFKKQLTSSSEKDFGVQFMREYNLEKNKDLLLTLGVKCI